jgi:preprotein translocase subunit SecB
MENQDPSVAGQEAPQVEVNAQYVKDFSFENPNAPASLMVASKQPKIDLSINIAADRMAEDVYEVVLHIHATATKAEGDGPDAVFLLDLQYAGVFTVRHVPEDRREMLLFVYCPSLLFPFARSIVSEATRDGGFPPLMLNPIDFMSLYLQRMQESQDANE